MFNSNLFPKVSVLVITYNHINFIAQALDSVLVQKVDFDYEILISEDYSTDGTRELVVNYQQRFPEKIRLILSEKNIRSNQVVARGIHAARGKYIALLDGDDYWTSPYKLQKQVDFLDKHPECSMCFHNVLAFYENSDQESWHWNSVKQKEFSTLEDIWKGNFIATCSTMFRRGLFGEVPSWYDDFFPITDWPLHILNAGHGLIGYIPEVMGAYRHHTGGLYSIFDETERLKKIFDFYKKINLSLEFRYDAVIRSALSNYFYEWAEEYEKRGNLQSAKKCFEICLSEKPFNKFIRLQSLLKLWIKIYFTPYINNCNKVINR